LVLHGIINDGNSQSHTIDETDLGLAVLQCSECNSHIGFLEIDTISSQFTYLVHSHSITKQENLFIALIAEIPFLINLRICQPVNI